MQDNWHGKAVPADTIEAIEQRIVHKDGETKLTNKAPIMDAPEIHLPIGKIKMVPPEYKIGDKVRSFLPKIS